MSGPDWQDPLSPPGTEELQAVASTQLDEAAAADEILTGLEQFRDVVAEGSPEEKKIFARAFIHEITINPDELCADVYLKQLPLLPSAGSNGNSSFTVVAGTCYVAIPNPA